MHDGELILVAGGLLAAGLAASLAAGRLRLPGLVLFLGVGMALGSDGLGLIDFSDYELARRIGVIALALILFEGGLSAGFGEIRPVLRPALNLAVFGTFISAALVGLAATWLLGLSTLEALLLGAILATTDSAAIFSLLRHSTLRRKLARTLEGESGFNDPVAILLVLGFIEWIRQPDWGVADMALLFASQLGIGVAVGLGLGWLGVQAFRRADLATAGLYPVASIAMALLAYGLADSLHGSGFMSVYLAGLVLGSAAIPARQTVTTFHQGLAWVAQIVLFLSLGLLVFPSQLGGIWLEGTLIAVAMAVVARPVAVAIATAADRYTWSERIVLGWAGLRGAIPVVLATFPVIAEVPGSQRFFNIVFFVVVISTLLQGTTFEPLARVLGATTAQPAIPRPLAETGTIRRLGAEIVEFAVGPEDAIAGLRVREIGLPRDALLNVIVREDEAIPPRGSTRIEPGDRLHILVRQEVSHLLPELLDRWRRGPLLRGRRTKPELRAGRVIFTTRPWDEGDGDPGHPQTVLGIAVDEHLRTRRDVRGALVALSDGRYAITGPTLAIGSPRQLQRYSRRRLSVAEADAERAWWQETLGALAS
jgi:cell volume regulation protein A